MSSPSARRPAAPSSGGARPARAARLQRGSPDTAQPACAQPAAAPRRAAVALIPALHLDGVRPFVTRQAQQHFHEAQVQADTLYQTQLALAEALLTSGVLPSLSTTGSVEERLEAALLAIHPANNALFQLTVEGDHLHFTAENDADGAVSLAQLHHTLCRSSPQILPSLLAALENLSVCFEPVYGPRAAEGIAEYIWSFDWLHMSLLEEERVSERASQREILRIARRLGLDHPYSVRDTHPWLYFAPPLDVDALIAALAQLDTRTPWGAALRPLAGLLADLQRCAAQVPEMQDTEMEGVVGATVPTTVYTVSPKPYCTVLEVIDVFVRGHWEGGEDCPVFSLQVTQAPASHQRLVTYLALHQQGTALLAQINDVLVAANEACPAVKL